MEDKPNYYAIIPAEVRYDINLKDKAKLLYGEITSLSDKNGYCYATNKYFADLYGVTTTTISLLINNLIDKGYIEREIIYKDGTKEILNRYLKIVKGGYLKNFKEGTQKKLKENNTSINNTSNNKKEIYKESWDCDSYVKQLTDGVISYLNEKSERNFKPNNSKTQSLVRARLKEGFSEIDFLQVIEKKCQDWLNTDMEKYLRPETLFGNKFENYVNERRRK